MSDLKLPPGEIGMADVTGASGKHYVISKKAGTTNAFSIFSEVDGKAKRLGKGTSPLVLEEKYAK